MRAYDKSVHAGLFIIIKTDASSYDVKLFIL
jgi:hypothetical protein